MSTCIWVTQNHYIMQHQQEAFLLFGSGSAEIKQSRPVFFPIKRGAFHREKRRSSRPRRRGEAVGIENAAVQDSSPEMNNSVWSSAGSLWCVIISVWATSFSPFKYGSVHLSRSLSLRFARPLSLWSVYSSLMSAILSVLVLLRVICSALPFGLLRLFFLSELFHMSDIFLFLWRSFFPRFWLVSFILKVLHMLLSLVIRLQMGILCSFLFFGFIQMPFFSRFLRMFFILSLIQVLLIPEVIRIPLFVFVLNVGFLFFVFIQVLFVRIWFMFRLDVQSPVTNTNKVSFFTSVQEPAHIYVFPLAPDS